MKRIFAIALFLSAVAPFVYAEEGSPKAKTVSATAEEREVLSKLHVANEKEIKAGGLAVEHGQTKGIRSFGQMMVDEHTAADGKLTALATRKDVMLPELESSVLDPLRAAKETEFDREFITMMVKDHNQAIKLVREAQGKVHDKDVLAFLGDVLPTLQKHRDAAERLQNPGRAEASPHKL